MFGWSNQCQRLPLGLEAGDDLPGVHAGLDQLDGDQALHRLGLLCLPDAAHAALADRLDELLRADHRAGAFGTRSDGELPGRGRADRRPLEVIGEPLMLTEQCPDPSARTPSLR
jgi:hypothetical protein